MSTTPANDVTKRGIDVIFPLEHDDENEGLAVSAIAFKINPAGLEAIQSTVESICKMPGAEHVRSITLDTAQFAFSVEDDMRALYSEEVEDTNVVWDSAVVMFKSQEGLGSAKLFFEAIVDDNKSQTAHTVTTAGVSLQSLISRINSGISNNEPFVAVPGISDRAARQLLSTERNAASNTATSSPRA